MIQIFVSGELTESDIGFITTALSANYSVEFKDVKVPELTVPFQNME